MILRYFKHKLSSTDHLSRTVFRIDVKDENNRLLYALLVATGSSGFANIIKDLKTRLDEITIKDMKSVYEQLIGRSKSIIDYI